MAAGLSLLAMLVGSVAVAAANPASAAAAEYPSWEDVLAARSNQAAADAKAVELREHLAGLETRAAATATAAQAKGAELQEAQDLFDEAFRRGASLDDQAGERREAAAAAVKRAGLLASQLARSGGTDFGTRLFLSEPSDDLLGALGSIQKLAERYADVSAKADAATRTADAVAEQADIASTERERLRGLAADALAQAREAAAADQTALESVRAEALELNAKLAALTDGAAKTAAEYQAGLAAEAASGGGSGGGGGGGGGGGLPGGSVGPQGWAVPASGPITDHYGPRQPICGPDGCSGPFHSGTDIGTGCGAPIYAAAAGRVDYAGWMGTYGNFVLLAHGGGIDTGYAHIRSGGIVVGDGQQVSAGQLIAWSGTTGASNGCHLHFEVRLGGGKTDPVPFMRQREAPLG